MAEMRGVGRVSKTGCEKIDGARMTDQAWKKIRGHGFHSDAPPSEDEAILAAFVSDPGINEHLWRLEYTTELVDSPYCSGKGHGHAQANC
tara:strand:+ start:817 stop:1086 length:270 start_codon:yes stop_codon:yes gene_type:complete